ncbi:DoxX family membrane protein [Aeromicrobium ginsengisoli]|uniref:DoxX family membrane protein n=1 Tax=Aeromicrobium ginsengisoli TaxID=363867 RepID=A0A5M4FB25_9ACTN|nr:DoxX family membrane protein [Aeromicrobium ginsengisoli]KAA1395544.1 DoxX family membrane protein [Aeromicrobium ginsengisoli]
MTATFAANHARTIPVTAERTAPMSLLLGVIRLAMGWTFLWPFLDKTFGLGHETASADAWVNGGSPTSGFLGHATKGPFSDMYQGFAGQAWADWLFMLGLLGIGAALILGVAVRAAAAAGALLLVLMWTAVLPPDNNIFLDDHLIYAMVLGVLALAGAGRTLGFGKIWEKLPIVKKHAVLR